MTSHTSGIASRCQDALVSGTLCRRLNRRTDAAQGRLRCRKNKPAPTDRYTMATRRNPVVNTWPRRDTRAKNSWRAAETPVSLVANVFLAPYRSSCHGCIPFCFLLGLHHRCSPSWCRPPLQRLSSVPAGHSTSVPKTGTPRRDFAADRKLIPYGSKGRCMLPVGRNPVTSESLLRLSRGVTGLRLLSFSATRL
jgi:hypothetical protein